jgi:integrase
MAMSKSRRTRPRGTIERLQSGSLRVKVYAGIDPVSKRRLDLTETVPSGPKAEQEAEDALVRLLNEVNEKAHPRTNATVNELLDRYLQLLNVERTTRVSYERNADLHIRPLIGKEKVGRVGGEILDSLYGELRRCRVHCRRTRGLIDHRTTRPHNCDHRCRQHRCEPLGEGTIRKIHYILSGAFKKAKYWGWITIDPIDNAEPPPPAAANPQPPSASEAATILNAAWQSDPDWGMQIWLLMITGARRGEICAIRWRHLDLENGVLHMTKAIAQDGTEIWEKDTKTHQDRRIVLDPETVQLMGDHWNRCTDRAQEFNVILTKNSYVFSTEPDRRLPLKPSSVSQRYRRLVRKLGIDTHLHALRHYSATELIAAGVDIRTVAGRLGHGGGGTTTLRVYAAWLSEADQRASTALLNRRPKRPTQLTPHERAKTDPQAPFERIAVQVRSEILAGSLVVGDLAPSVKELQTTHGVSAGTAHRAIGLLRQWELVSPTVRGQRATILRPPESDVPTPNPATASRPSDHEPESSTPLLDLRLLRLGRVARSFQAEADPNDPKQLHRLLNAAARRHDGENTDISDYELEVRRAGGSELLTTFAAL